jgi:hypothetical protein
MRATVFVVLALFCVGGMADSRKKLDVRIPSRPQPPAGGHHIGPASVALPRHGLKNLGRASPPSGAVSTVYATKLHVPMDLSPRTFALAQSRARLRACPLPRSHLTTLLPYPHDHEPPPSARPLSVLRLPRAFPSFSPHSSATRPSSRALSRALWRRLRISRSARPLTTAGAFIVKASRLNNLRRARNELRERTTPGGRRTQRPRPGSALPRGPPTHCIVLSGTPNESRACPFRHPFFPALH